MLVPTTCFNCESACGLLAYVDRETLQVRKFEGNPEHPGSRGRNCAKGPATLNQVTDPDRILFPLKRAGQARREPLAARLLGRGPRRHRAAHPQGDRREAQQRGDVPRGPPRRGRLHRARPRRLGRRRPQLAHEHLLVGGARRLPVVDGLRPPEPRPRERRRHPAHQLAPRVRALLQPARPAGHGGEEERGEADRARHAALEHRDPRRPLARALAGHRAGDPPRDREPPDPERPLRPRVRAALVELAGVPRGGATRSEPATFEAFERALRAALRRVHVRLRRSASRASTRR